MKNSILKTNLLLALLCLLWGSTWLAIKISLVGIPPFIGVIMRFLIAGVLLLVVSIIISRKLSLTKFMRFDIIICGVFMYGSAYALVYWGEQYISSGLSSVIFAAMPFYVGIMAHFWVKGERLSWPGILEIMVGFLGVYLVFKDNLHVYGKLGIYGMIVMSIAPIFSAIGAIIVKTRLADYEPISLTGFQMLCGALCLMPIAFGVENLGDIHMTASSFLALLYLAVFGSAVTFVVYYRLIKTEGVTKVSLIAFVTPLVAVLIGTLVNHERISGGLLLGGTLVAIGIAIINKMYRLIWKFGEI